MAYNPPAIPPKLLNWKFEILKSANMIYNAHNIGLRDIISIHMAETESNSCFWADDDVQLN